jgi:hypothetical protein
MARRVQFRCGTKAFRQVGVSALGHAAVTPDLTRLRRASLAVREALGGLLQRPLGLLWEI